MEKKKKTVKKEKKGKVFTKIKKPSSKSDFFNKPFFKKVKNSFQKRLLVASVIETAYLVLVFFGIKIFLDLILPLFARMENAKDLLLSIESKAFNPLMKVEVEQILAAKNSLLLYFAVFIMIFLIFNFVKNGLLWQFLLRKKFSIKKYGKVFLGTVSIYAVFVILLLIGLQMLKEDWPIVVYSIFLLYFMSALKNIIRANIMKYDKFNLRTVKDNYFSFGFLFFPLLVFAIAIFIINQAAISVSISWLVLIINLFILAFVIGWYKSFVLEYV